MRFDYSAVSPLCEGFGVTLTKEITERLDIFGSLLVERNKSVNLTAITDPEGIVNKHFYDSVLFFKNIHPNTADKIIDVGTGAGFPGVVLKIVRPDINLTLMDALAKRLDFISEVLAATDLTAEIIHARAEDGGRDAALRESFDFATARAVAALPVLCELCIPFVKPGGSFVAMKGDAAGEEAALSQNAYKVLGAAAPEIYNETLPGGEARAFIISKKISQTSPKYPRSFAKIKKNAL